MELHDHDVRQLARPRDAVLERGLVDRTAHAVEADETELDPTNVDDCDGAEPAV